MHACAMMMNDDGINALTAWLADAGLAGESETALVHGFCERAIAAGLPIGRALMFIDTLHPVHEGRVFRWGHDPSEPLVQAYGRTGSASAPATDTDANERWRRSPFFRMLQTGESQLRRPLIAEGESEFFSPFRDARCGNDGLCRDHQPLRPRGRHRRDGLRLLLVGDRQSRRLHRKPDRSPDESHAVPGAGNQGGRARPHDGNADGNLSRPRCRPARAQRPHHARRCRPHRRRHLVQRPARIHAHHQFRSRAGHSAPERLRRCHRLGHPRPGRGRAQAHGRRHARHLCSP